MKVKDLILLLSSFDQELEVYISERGGCSECNPEGIDYYDKLDDYMVGQHKEVHVNGYRKPPVKCVVI